MNPRPARILAALALSLGGAAGAAERQDPASSPEIVRLSEEATDCLYRNYRRERLSVTDAQARDEALKKRHLLAAARACTARIALLSARYDAVFGPGTGQVFLDRSFTPHANRAIMERFYEEPSERREVAKLQRSGRYISGGQTARCPYKGLLSVTAQEAANRKIGEIRLREDLIGKRFAVTDVSFDLPSVERDAISYDLSDPKVAEFCFPAYKARMDRLRDEYAARTGSPRTE